MNKALIFTLLFISCIGMYAQTSPSDIIRYKKISSNNGNLGSLPYGGRFGNAVASIGDINNDGVDDLAVGAHTFNSYGAVYILFMDTSGTVLSKKILTQNSHGVTGLTSKFGMALCPLGDINGDGVNDLAVGEPGCNNGGSNTGAIHILRLDTSGSVIAQNKISKTVGYLNGGLGLQSGSYFGRAIDTIGDINGDGNIDIVVGSYYDSQYANKSGAAYVLLMDSVYKVSSYKKIYGSTQNFTNVLSVQDYFGIGAAGVGDFNKDGINDIAVGAFYDDDGSSDAGAVYIINLNTDGSVKSYTKISNNSISGSNPISGRFGIAISLLPDMYGDGQKDIAVGAFRHNGDYGGVYIINLDTNLGVASYKIHTYPDIPNSSSSRVGISLDYYGDYNSDGSIELITAAAYENSDQGSLYILTLKSQFEVSIQGQDVTCYNGSDGSATAQVVSSSQNISYLWNTGDTSSTISGLSAGTYTVTVSDGIGNSTSSSVVITQPATILLNLTQDDSICQGESILLSATAAGGVGALTFHWNQGLGGSGSHMVYPATTTTYSVYATDTNNCSSNTQTVQVVVNPVPSVSLTTLSDMCYGSGNVSLSGGLPVGGYYLGSGVANGVFNPSVAGIGTHTIAYIFGNAQGCTDTAYQPLQVHALPIVDYQQTISACTNGAGIQLSGATPSGGIFSGTGVSNGYFDPALAGSGSHFIIYTVMDSNSCTNSDVVSAVVHNAPQVNAGSDQHIAHGTSTTLSGTASGAANYTYQWQPDSLLVNPDQANTSTTILTSQTNFTLTVTDTLTSCSDTDMLTVYPCNAVSSSVFPSTVNLCLGDTQVLIVNPGGGNGTFSYLWSSIPAGFSSTVQNPSVSPTTSTKYVVEVSSGGCTASDTIDVIVQSYPLLNLGNDTSLCDPATLTLDAGSGYNDYLWSTGETTQSIILSTAMLSMGINAVSVEVNSSLSCSGSDEILVTKAPAPYVNLGGIDTMCNDDSKYLDAGFGYSSYLWFTGETSQMILLDSNNISAGLNDVWVQVWNQQQCSSTDSTQIVMLLCTGIRNMEKDAVLLQIIPQPNQGHFTLHAEGLEPGHYQLTIVSQTGQAVYIQDMEVDSVKLSTSIQLPEISNGVYNLVIHGEEAFISTKLVIHK